MTQKIYGKWLVIFSVLLAIVAVAYYVLKPKPQAPNHITANVTRMDIENNVMASGKIEAKHTVDIGSQVSGEVTNLYVDIGDVVKKGEIIAQIDPLTQKNHLTNQQANLEQSLANLESSKANLATRQASLESSKADLASREASLAQAQSDYARIQSLATSNAVSIQEIEKALTSVKTAQASIKKSQTEVSTAQKNLNNTRITAPMSGTVISISTKQGQTVNANQSAPTIVTLADLSTVRVKAKISEADVIDLKAGMPVYFNVIGNADKKINATLQAIEPAPENTTANTNNSDSTVYYMGYFDVPNPD